MNIRHDYKKGLELINEIAFRNGFEIWKQIEGYLNYSVSNKGRVRNETTGRILKPSFDSDCYHIVSLCNNNIKKTWRIHKLVANAFIQNHENKKCIDHKNNNRIDNNVYNLRWVTNQENQCNLSMYSTNTSGVKGVIYETNRKKWRAQITQNGKNIHIGRYNTLEEAKQARQEKSKQLFGEYQNSCEK